jgi:hypothetical protein
MRLVIVVAASAALSVSAFAQPAGTGGSPPTPTPPASSQPSNNPSPTPTEPAGGQSSNTPAPNKRSECRKEARDQNLSGPDLRDHMQICIMEARLNCLKQAVAQKVRGRFRREGFIRRCMG